ncbi:MAG: RNA polymerase sigma factor [Solirubrobacteraceae bacterium]
MALRDFAGIYDEHIWRVYGFFAYWVRSRQDAEDLTQQTFERALGAWDRYDESRSSVSTWLLVIARNLLIDHMRASKSSRYQQVDVAALESIAASPDRPGLGLDPELERALAELSTREREMIALRFGGDLSGREIAQLTGLSLANVQQILSRALRRMHASLDGSELQAEAAAPARRGSAR